MTEGAVPRASSPDDVSSTLLDRWQEHGDHEALERLIQVEVRLLRDKLRRRAGDRFRPSRSSSDVAQEAVMGWLGARNVPRFDHPRALRGYLWTVAWRLLGHHLRKRRHRHAVLPLDSIGTVELCAALATDRELDIVVARERRVGVQIALTLLRSDDRDILMRAYFGHQSAEEIATAIGITPDAVSMRLTRARRRLAEKMKAWADAIE